MTFYWNKTAGKFPGHGGKPVLITQQEFEDCCCGSDEPCVDCGETPSGDAIVTVTGDCNDPTGQCAGAAQTYSPYTFVECQWCWCTDIGEDEWCHGYQLCLIYNPITGRWDGYIGDFTEEVHPVLFTKTAITGIVCNPATHQLEGSFDLDGVDHASGSECTGCTAHVTL